MKFVTMMGLEIDAKNNNEFWFGITYPNDIDNYLRSLQLTDGKRYYNKIIRKDRVDWIEDLLIRGGYAYRSKLTGKLEAV